MNIQNKSMSNRWNHIDLMKCIGIFFVVMYHSTTYPHTLTLAPSYELWFFRSLLRTPFAACVPIFFFANGYLLLNREFSLKKHIIKLLNMLLLTILWAIIILLVLSWKTGEKMDNTLFIYRLQNLEPIGWINHLWYMGTLAFIYIFFPLLKHAYDTNRTYFLYFTIVCTILTIGNTLMGTISTLINNQIDRSNFFGIFNPFYTNHGYAFAYFCIGGLAHEYQSHLEKIAVDLRNLISSIIIIVSSFISWILAIKYTAIGGTDWDSVWYGYDTIFTLLITGAIFVLSLSYQKHHNFIHLISKNALGIYFMHPLLIKFFDEYVCQLPFLWNYTANILYTILIVLLCTLIAECLKKVPALRFLVKM